MSSVSCTFYFNEFDLDKFDFSLLSERPLITSIVVRKNKYVSLKDHLNYNSFYNNFRNNVFLTSYVKTINTRRLMRH